MACEGIPERAPASSKSDLPVVLSHPLPIPVRGLPPKKGEWQYLGSIPATRSELSPEAWSLIRQAGRRKAAAIASKLP